MGKFFSDTKPLGHEVPGDLVTNIHGMVDVETMGLKEDCPILTIGAVLFDPYEQDDVGTLEKRAFLRRVDVQDAVEQSGRVEGSTLKWWLQQEDAAIKELVHEDTVPMVVAMRDLRRYLADRAPELEDDFFPGFSKFPIACALWAKSPDFDCAKLRHTADRVGETLPLRFFQWRCVRTVQDLAWPEGPDARPVFKAGVAHDARADAVQQALMVQAAYKELGLSKSNVKFDKF